jgi:hypothetical protein
MNIRKLGALMTVLGGCSFGMRGLDPAWDGIQEPVCADSYAPVVIDGFAATVLAAVVAQPLPEGTPPLEPSIVLGALGLSLIYTVSAARGATVYRACRRARADFQVRDALAGSNAKPGGPPGSLPAPGAPAAPGAQVASTTSAVQATPGVRSGYFCTSSHLRPELGVCLRERATCERARTIISALDSEDCAPRSVAWCFEAVGTPRCFATMHVCEAHMARATAVSSVCADRP